MKHVGYFLIGFFILALVLGVFFGLCAAIILIPNIEHILRYVAIGLFVALFSVIPYMIGKIVLG